MSMSRKIIVAILSIVGALGVVLGMMPAPSKAASHREAPLISLDPTADITDFFMFRSYEPGKEDKVVFIMDVIPGEEPSSGPNYWNFDPSVLYSFNIDTNADGESDDIQFEFRFKNEFRGINKDAGLFLSYVALPPITALDGAGSEGLGLRQKYSVTMVRNGDDDKIADNLIAVPSNVGPRTMPNYDALAAQGIYDLGNGVRVFAGQREDPFYIDLGSVFDTLNFRRNLPLLTADEDANDNANPFGVDMLGGFNVHTIAIEVPASMLTEDGRSAEETEQPWLGAYASTSRRKVRVLREDGRTTYKEGWVQVQRLANPLVNEAIIGTGDKDRWNRLDPDRENQFIDFYRNPRLALAEQIVFGVPANTGPRNDLVDLLLKYPGQDSDTPLSELLRLNLQEDPKALADQKRLTVLAGDAAGWPNGRRPKDDVTDIAIRVVGGENYIVNRAGDGVNTNDSSLTTAFPFLATPFDGRSSRHPNTP